MTISSVPPIPKSNIQLFLGIRSPHGHFILDEELDALLERSGSSLSDFKDSESGLASDKLSKIIGNIATDISARGDYVTKKIAEYLGLNPDLVSLQRIELKTVGESKDTQKLSNVMLMTDLKIVTGNEVVYATLDDDIFSNLQFPAEWLCEPFEKKLDKQFKHLNKQIRNMKKRPSLKAG